MKDEAQENSYIVVYYIEDELNSKTFSYTSEAAKFLEELAETGYGFDPHIHAMVIKTGKDMHSILTVETRKVTRVHVGDF